MYIYDLADKPGWANIDEQNYDSVTLGQVILKTENKEPEKPYCTVHGFMDNEIEDVYRCEKCKVACYAPAKKLPDKEKSSTLHIFPKEALEFLTEYATTNGPGKEETKRMFGPDIIEYAVKNHYIEEVLTPPGINDYES